MTTDVFGRFNPVGYFVRLNGYSRDEIGELIRHAGVDGTPASRAGRSFAPLGTFFHESVHCCQIASTPFGQFWIRTLLAQSNFTELNFRGMFEGRGTPRVSLPLARNWPRDAGAGTREIFGAMQHLWSMLDTALEMLISDSAVEMELACRLVASSFRYTFELGYFDRGTPALPAGSIPTLVTNLTDGSKSTPAIQGHPLTTSNVLECHARLIEKELLLRLDDVRAAKHVDDLADASADTIALKLLGAWHGMLIEYPAEVVYTLFALSDLALFAPLDPALAGLWSSAMLWEDVHPAYRFAMAAQITREIGFLRDERDFVRYQNEICERAGWHTPGEIIDVLLPALEASPSAYDRLFVACLEGRRERPHVFAFDVGWSSGFGVPVVIYDDRMIVCDSRLNPQASWEENIGRFTRSYLAREVGRQLLFEDAVAIPEAFDEPGLDLGELLKMHFGIQVSS